MSDTVTCGHCLTLNPPGVPACVRCNSPLSGPAAGPPAGLPRAPVPAPEPAAPSGPPRGRGQRRHTLSPAEQRRAVRRIQIAGVIVVVLVLVVGGFVVWTHRPRSIDTGAVAHEVEAQLGRQLGQKVRLTCPATAARTRGTTFRCTATDSAGARRTVVVTVTGDDGSYRWELR